MNRLSELLAQARTDAPPLRYDVDDMVAAGRARQRRRNTGWAIAAVVAVATAIGVPQIVARPDGAPPALPAATSTATPSAAPEVRFPSDFTFRGYTAGSIQVDDPVGMGLDSMSAEVRESGAEDAVGVLVVYRVGVEPTWGDVKIVKTAPVRGHRAFYVRESDGTERLTWEYTAGGLAQVGPRTASPMTRSAMRQAAEGFSLGGGRPLRIALRVPYIPDDYRLIRVGEHGGTLVTEPMAREMLDRPDRAAAPGAVEHVLRILLEEVRAGDYPETTGKPACSSADGECHQRVGGGRYRLTVHGQGIAMSEVRKVFNSVQVADLDDRSAWFPAGEAFPTFVRLAID